jgi:hypothetical protein
MNIEPSMIIRYTSFKESKCCRKLHRNGFKMVSDDLVFMKSEICRSKWRIQAGRFGSMFCDFKHYYGSQNLTGEGSVSAGDDKTSNTGHGASGTRKSRGRHESFNSRDGSEASDYEEVAETTPYYRIVYFWQGRDAPAMGWHIFFHE